MLLCLRVFVLIVVKHSYQILLLQVIILLIPYSLEQILNLYTQIPSDLSNDNQCMVSLFIIYLLNVIDYEWFM